MFFAITENGNIKSVSTMKLLPMKGQKVTTITKEEYQKFMHSANKVPDMVTITIPLAVFQASADLQKKLSEMALIFSDIKRRPDADGNLVLSNINIDHVHAFLTATEHTQLKKVGVVFDARIDALFANDENATKTTETTTTETTAAP